MNKFENFPSVNYVSLIESEDRRKILNSEFEIRGIGNVTPHLFHRYDSYQYVLIGNLVNEISQSQKGILTSHLKTIKRWVTETNEPYTLICEDDISLETTTYWNFKWNDFMSSLPNDWDVVILTIIKDVEITKFTLKERGNWDWGGSAYLIRREYAKRLINVRMQEGYYNLQMVDNELIPLAENSLFFGLGKVYNCPLLVENLIFDSTYEEEKDELQNNNHTKSRDTVLNWWKDVGRFLDAKDLTNC
jgi:GR25 family glycosyltransferase involved in LPS biosynthesis